MKHALIIASPNLASFTATMAKACAEAAANRHEVPTRGPCAIGFDPRLGWDEIPGPSGFAPHHEAKGFALAA
jgi:putative NADPH-quinone reductase